MAVTKIMTQRRWATAYAMRVGPIVNLLTLAAIGMGNLIWIAYDEGSPLRRNNQPLVGPWLMFSLISSIIAAMVALLFVHLLISIPAVRDSSKATTAFEATAAITVAGPVTVALYLTIGPAFALAAGVLHVWLIVAVARLIGRRLPPYPGSQPAVF